jgi:diguanylate cyclase (GGDEF)-like protein
MPEVRFDTSAAHAATTPAAALTIGRLLPPDVPPSDDESQRLAALYRYGVLDTGPEPAFDALATLAAWTCGASTALVSLVDRDRLWFKAHIGLAADSAPRGHAPCASAIERPDEMLVVPDASGDPRFAPHPAFQPGAETGGGWRFYAGAPLVTPQGWPIGTLCVLDREPKQLGERQQEALRMLADLVVDQLELRRARTLLDAQCDTDEVTGAWNRHAFERRLAEEWTRWSRHGGHLALLAVDVDRFKHFNHVHGHRRGDEALQQVTSALERALRAHDVLAHAGAGEFWIVLPSTDAPGALAASERVRQAIAEIKWAVEPLTVSIGAGVAAEHRDVESATLASRAHRALTHAKAAGRNRVELVLD